MARQMTNPGLPNYGAVSERDIIFSGDNRELRLLCENISTNVYTINKATKNLSGALASIGTQRDTQGLRDQIHVWQLSSNEVVKGTTSDIRKLSTLSRTANKVERLQADKITNHFKEAVQGYNKIQLVVADKLRSNLPQTLPTTEDDTTLLLEDEERRQLQLQQQLQFDSGMLLEREQRVRQIETDILDVNDLMRELSTIVHEQGAAVDSIESSLETARGNVDAGASELQAAARYQNKARKRNIIIFAILATILTILIGIIIWSSR